MGLICLILNAWKMSLQDIDVIKDFQKISAKNFFFVDNSYPEYRRTNNGRTVLKTIAPGETIELDNRWVVPYCPKMLLKYRLKYIFNKYYLNYEKNVNQIYNL